MSDPRTNNGDRVALQWSDEFAITPNNEANLAQTAFGFYIGTGGTIKYVTLNGTTITKTVYSGSYHPIHIVKVFAADTTATGIIGIKY